MWEIFTCGSVPYAGIQVMRLASELRAGERLEKPGNVACLDNMMKNPCGARRKRFGALDSCFGLVSPHQQSIPFPYLQAPRVIKLSSSAALVVLN